MPKRLQGGGGGAAAGAAGAAAGGVLGTATGAAEEPPVWALDANLAGGGGLPTQGATREPQWATLRVGGPGAGPVATGGKLSAAPGPTGPRTACGNAVDVPAGGVHGKEGNGTVMGLEKSSKKSNASRGGGEGSSEKGKEVSSNTTWREMMVRLVCRSRHT